MSVVRFRPQAPSNFLHLFPDGITLPRFLGIVSCYCRNRVMRLTEPQILQISSSIADSINEMVAEHFGQTQEHHLTPRIGQHIEDSLGGRFIGSSKISVITQDLKDKGSRSLEKKLGFDLYVGISLEDEFDKGIIVQSKISGKSRGLKDQCERMLNMTKQSYVWEYNKNGVKVKRAQSVLNKDSYAHGDETWSSGLEYLFAQVLRCKSGDRSIGIAPGPNRRQRLGRQLDEWAVKAGVLIEIKPA